MRSTGTKLAIFTAFTILVTFWLASVIGKLAPFDNTFLVNAVFSDATGILNGDPVTVAGVNVGKVTSFEVEGGEAIVSMELDGDLELPNNVQIEIKYRNLLGQRLINILEPDSSSSTLLEDGDTIPVTQTKPALDLSIVFDNLRPLIQSTNPEDINTVARAVLAIFKGREGDLAGILGDVGEITQTLADRDQRLARLVGDLDDVTKILNGQSTNIKTSLDQFSEFLESVSDMTPSLDRAVVQLDEASRRFGSLISRNRTNLDQELSDLSVVLGIVDDNLGPLAKIAQNLKEVLLATARTQTYGKWWNLYVVNLCPETGTGGCTAVAGERP